MQLQVLKEGLLKHSYLLVRKDRSDLEELRKEQQQELEVRKKDLPLEKQVLKEDRLRHNYLLVKKDRLVDSNIEEMNKSTLKMLADNHKKTKKKKKKDRTKK